ncbi:inner-membrane translocator [Thermogladius calderae 1633]|uniref:Inner-membrane translocator n=1 Tax=Thermogladius calderae (strain DSM 22663 / VKM B-2946 / 1633) TaxID=1184251 RepID=I3TEK6_THEC1|nr:ABC transporter permease [Thermogladius calderae]AFK51194.1 inner-membrane translocator [Thermogladius calderae 1633]
MGYVIRIRPKPAKPLAIVLAPVASFALAFFVGGLLMVWAGVDPISGYTAFVSGSLTTFPGFMQTLVQATLFMLMATGIAISNRAGVLNVGAEGQYIVGAILATYVAVELQQTLHPALVVVLAMLLAAVGGALWAAIPGVLRGYMNVNEVVTTVILNWLAYRILQWIIRGPLRLPGPQLYPMSPPVTATLPILEPSSGLNAGLVIAVALAVFSYFLLFNTEVGFKIRVTGSNPDLARYAGFGVERVIVLSMGYSGALAGIAGGVEVLGNLHYLFEGISIGLGYTSIIVSLVARDHPLGVIAASIMFGTIYSGSSFLQTATHLTYTFSKALEGLIYLFVLVTTLFAFYEIKLVKVS